MKIASSQVVMASHNEYKESKVVQESLRKWQDGAPNGDHLTLSSFGLSKSQQALSASAWLLDAAPADMDIGLGSAPLASGSPSSVDEEDLLSDEDQGKIKMLEKMIEWLTGKKFKFNHVGIQKLKEALREGGEGVAHMPSLPAQANGRGPGSPSGPQRVGWGIDYQYRETHYQSETTQFAAAGQVVTEDGRHIDFELNFHMSRELYSEFAMHFKAGDALIDPLVIQLGDGPLQLSDDKIRFDIDVDGLADEISLPLANAGVLFYDRNQNGIADDGSELFGPTTGNGFDELRALDEDHNGWFDENDSFFSQLRLWIRSPEGENKVLGLIEAGVGAIFLESSATAFELQTSTQDTAGRLRETSLYLKESGQAGLVHEIDLKI